MANQRNDFSFDEGDRVRVTDGPFAKLYGSVSEVWQDRSELLVIVSVFHRPTPVRLGFRYVEKV